ncbi:MAG: hypothetical protein H6868_06660 [Rhodospirillales bacterium]|nr:hypothetical protein [Rhodospirillales bacterium]
MAVDFNNLIATYVGCEPSGLPRKIFQSLTDNQYFPNHFKDSLILGHRHFLFFETATLKNEEIADFFGWKLQERHQRDAFKISYIEHVDKELDILFIGFRDVSDAHAFCRDFRRDECIISLEERVAATNKRARKAYKDVQKLAP